MNVSIQGGTLLYTLFLPRVYLFHHLGIMSKKFNDVYIYYCDDYIYYYNDIDVYNKLRLVGLYNI